MAIGLLQIHGTLDVAQFWPDGTSDTDTAKVTVDAGADAVQFRPSDKAPLRSTRFYVGATVKGRTSKPPLDKQNRFTIRLQGIDAPELHYQPMPLTPEEKKGASTAALAAFKKLNVFYREPLGPTSTDALHDYFHPASLGSVACRVWTRVDHPNEVFDTYGRLVGDIEVKSGTKKVDLNLWLVEHGWAYPTFYSSMSNDEITTILQRAKVARKARRGVWKRVSKTIGAFDFDLLEPKKGDTKVLAADKGPALFPKLFRRQCSWAARKKAVVTRQNLQAYLEAGEDFCFETDDFLANGIYSAKPYPFSSFVDAGRTVNFEPGGLVFQEAPSTLIGADGKEITQF